MRLRADDITWREIDGDLVVLDLRSSTYLTANASASVLLQELVEHRTLHQLSQALVDAYAVSERRALEDVVAFLAELGERGLLEASPRERPRDPVAASRGR